MKHTRMATLMFGVALGLGTLAANAQAQDRVAYGAQASPQVLLTQWGSYNNSHFDHGYRDGMDAGGKDARKGKGFIADEHGSYRDSHDRAYRDGYMRGYREAYDQYAHYRDGHYRDGYGHDNGRDDQWRDHDWH